MKALLLAGGYGTRLRPITNSTPKCLVEIKGRPLLDYWLEIALDKLNCSEVVVNTHYLAGSVESFVRSSGYRDKITLVHEEHLLGTLNTVRKNLQLIEDNEVLIAHADNYCIADWEGFAGKFGQREEDIHLTMMTFDTNMPQSCGMVELDQEGRIRQYVEKPQFPWGGTTANGAVFLADLSALNAVQDAPEQLSDICKDFIPRFLPHINCFHNSLVHIDIGTPEKLTIANEL